MSSTYSQWSGSIRIILIAAYLFALFSIFFLFPLTAHADSGFPFLGVLHAGQRPEAIAVDTQTHLVYIAYEYPAQLVAFDPLDGKVHWRTTVGGSVSDVQVDSTTHRVYAVGSPFNDNQGVLVVLNGVTGQTLLTAKTGAGDNGIAVDTQRQRVYVTSTNDGQVNVFSLTTSPTGQLSATSATLKLGQRPQALGVDSHLGRLYVGDVTKNVVTVYDEDSGRTLATIAVAATPVQPLRVDEAKGRVYVVCSDGQELDVIDEHSNTVMARVPVSPYPEGVAFNTATGRIYVADEGNKDSSNSDNSTGTTITVIDGQSFDVLGTLQVGHAPDGVEADPLLRRVYVSTENSDAVVEISDSVDIPLKSDMNFRQITAIRRGISLLQQATYITLLLMLLTIVGATLGVLLPHWRVRGNLQTRPTDASSR
jgi:YVTN family beta-propeller protein